MAMHVTAQRHWGAPQSSAEAFDLLARHGLISSELAAHMRSMAGFRNIATATGN